MRLLSIRTFAHNDTRPAPSRWLRRSWLAAAVATSALTPSIVRAATIAPFRGATAVTTSASPTADVTAFLNVLKASIKAENAKNAKAFLKLWTDKGLQEYDTGSRSEIESGKSDNFGTDLITYVNYGKPVITAESATIDIQATVGASTFAQALFLVSFKGLKKDGSWLINGFEFKGSPPPPPGTDVVLVTALNYAFSVNKTTAKRNVGFRFVNKTNEAHEITLFKTPKGLTIAGAKKALENVDGKELKAIPAGYQVSHISYAEPGQTLDITFAAPLAAGDYVIVCYLPKGGMDEHGEPKDPKGAPHVKLGMISLLRVG